MRSTYVCLLVLLAMMDFIMAASTDDDTPNARLLEVCLASGSEGSVDEVKKALEDGADINVADERSGQTPIMAATLRGKLDIFKFLLEKGADTSIGERQGYTPQHGAGFQGRVDIMKLLKEAGIDIWHVHEDGFTPFHRACWGSESRHTEVVRFFLEQGGDVNIKSSGEKKMTCLEMTSNEETKALLREYGAAEPAVNDGVEL